MDNNREIKIAGAGIAGLSASIILARAGYKVSVFEKEKEIGSRFKNDFQGIMNWGFKEDALAFMQRTGIGCDFEKKAIKEIEIFSPINKRRLFQMAPPFVYLIKRGPGQETLDYYLKKRALESGVKIIFNQFFPPESADIVATGPNSRKIKGMVTGVVFDTSSGDISSAIFDNKFSYKGYCYLFIFRGKGTIATVCLGKYDRAEDYLQKSLDFFKKNHQLEMKNVKKFSGVGSFDPFTRNEKAVGEAGGFQDYLWGFGIRYAMATADIMARSIINNENYQDLCEKELGGMMRAAISNRFVFSLLTKPSYNLICGFLKRKDPMVVFTRAYRPNAISRIIYPVSKIKFNIKNRQNRF
jgi:flavin-dependent dehydrogenase